MIELPAEGEDTFCERGGDGEFGILPQVPPSKARQQRRDCAGQQQERLWHISSLSDKPKGSVPRYCLWNLWNLNLEEDVAWKDVRQNDSVRTKKGEKLIYGCPQKRCSFHKKYLQKQQGTRMILQDWDEPRPGLRDSSASLSPFSFFSGEGDPLPGLWVYWVPTGDPGCHHTPLHLSVGISAPFPSSRWSESKF